MGRKLEKIFDEKTKNKSIYEAIIFIESGDTSFSWSRSYGDAAIDKPLIMASTSKLFTTTSIFKLLEQGKLSLHDKVCTYIDSDLLKGLHIYKGHDYSLELTIKDLLSQTSGLPCIFEDFSSPLKNSYIERDYLFSFEDLLSNTKKLKPHFVPGTKNRAHYADINFELLGRIIERITGLSLEEAYTLFIYEPLDLKNTYLIKDGSTPIPAIYYKDKAVLRPQFLSCCGASGGALSTAREMMVFIKAFFNGKLFPKSYIDDITTFNNLQLMMHPIHYGLGFMQLKMPRIMNPFGSSIHFLGHSGVTGSFAFYIPEKNIYMVGNTNQVSDPGIPIRLMAQMALCL